MRKNGREGLIREKKEKENAVKMIFDTAVK